MAMVHRHGGREFHGKHSIHGHARGNERDTIQASGAQTTGTSLNTKARARQQASTQSRFPPSMNSIYVHLHITQQPPPLLPSAASSFPFSASVLLVAATPAVAVLRARLTLRTRRRPPQQSLPPPLLLLPLRPQQLHSRLRPWPAPTGPSRPPA